MLHNMPTAFSTQFHVLLTFSINLQVLYHLHHSLLATFSGEDSHKKGTGELIGNFVKTPKRY